MGHARALLGLDDPAAIDRAARQIVDKQLSVRAVEALVKKARSPEANDRRPPAKSAEFVADRERVVVGGIDKENAVAHLANYSDQLAISAAGARRGA